MLSKMGSFWKFGKEKKWHAPTYPLKTFPAAVLSRLEGRGRG